MSLGHPKEIAQVGTFDRQGPRGARAQGRALPVHVELDLISSCLSNASRHPRNASGQDGRAGETSTTFALSAIRHVFLQCIACPYLTRRLQQPSVRGEATFVRMLCASVLQVRPSAGARQESGRITFAWGGSGRDPAVLRLATRDPSKPIP